MCRNSALSSRDDQLQFELSGSSPEDRRFQEDLYGKLTAASGREWSTQYTRPEKVIKGTIADGRQRETYTGSYGEMDLTLALPGRITERTSAVLPFSVSVSVVTYKFTMLYVSCAASAR
jgi:hypothetical protein